jgi:putative endonuclease
VQPPNTARASGPRKRLGDLGERLAARHLEAKGYRIVERNWRRREGEIDIIASRGQLMSFVEVRTRRGSRMGTACESITPTKAARMLALAEAYCAETEGLPELRRIDLVAVDFSPGGRLASLVHYENAVTAD